MARSWGVITPMRSWESKSYSGELSSRRRWAGARRGFRSWWMPVAQRDRGYLVPAGTTWSPILNYVHGTGDPWLFDLYKAGLPVTPDISVSP